MNILEDNIYQLDTRPQGAKTIEKMANTVKSLTTEPRSVSNVVNIQFKINSIYTPFDLYPTSNPNWKSNRTYFGKFYPDEFPILVGGGPRPEVEGYFLPNPVINYKINNIREIALTCNINTSANTFGTFAPIAQSNYSVDYYVAISLHRTALELYGGDFFIKNTMLYFPFKFTYTKSTDVWSVNETTTTVYLSNTIERNIILTGPSAGYEDWTNNPTQTKLTVFESLKTENNNLLIDTSFDRFQADALTGVSFETYQTTPSNSNKAHFEYFFGVTSSSLIAGADFNNAAILVQPYLNFNYFGLLTPYQPNS